MDASRGDPSERSIYQFWISFPVQKYPINMGELLSRSFVVESQDLHSAARLALKTMVRTVLRISLPRTPHVIIN